MEQIKKDTRELKNGTIAFLETLWAIGASVVAGDVLLWLIVFCIYDRELLIKII